MKKALALLLVVITLFSVMTIAASAEAAPIAVIDLPEAKLNIYNNLTETINAIGAWCEGVGAFLAALFVEPIIWILTPIVGFELV